MIVVELDKNESVQIKLKGADGSFHVSFGKMAVKIKADLPDDKKRKGTIYEHRYGDKTPGELLEPQESGAQPEVQPAPSA